jgi:hypothetical protein
MKSQIDCLKSAPFPIDYQLKIYHHDNTIGRYIKTKKKKNKEKKKKKKKGWGTLKLLYCRWKH